MTDKHAKEWNIGFHNLQTARNRYIDSLTAIKELAYFAVEHVAKLDEKRIIRSVQFSGTPLGLEFLRSYANTLQEVARETDPNGEVYPMQILEEHMQDYKKALSKEDAASLDSLVIIERSRPRTDLLLASLLIAAVSDFEVLFSSIVEFFYRARPEALRAQDAKLAWSEIEAYSSLDELKSHFIEERVTQLMWGGLDDWLKWLASQLKIRYQDVALDPDKTTELFQRRHVIVHNGGQISSQYLSKVTGTAATAKIGSPLPVSIDYLQMALNELSVLGLSISLLALRKLCPTEVEHATLDADIAELVLSLMAQRDWEPAQAICSITLPGIQHEYERCAVQVNKWASQKQLKGVDAIFREVSLWDVSALQPVFSLSKKALLEEPSAINMAKKLAGGSKSDKEAIRTWPVFEDIRTQIARLDNTEAGS